MTLEQFAPISAMLILSTAVSILIIFLSRLLGPNNPTIRKTAPYESGMKPIGEGTRRMPIKFYLVAVLFILFDIEVIFFLPWAVTMRGLGWYGLAAMGVFLFVLTVGFLYEWKKGALEWES
ncbi:MAG: NADH-quinone oxidoreductase subunit A [Phototrophicaceae bacterium]|jgi:NADH-quinone oxidoreductase subunit A